MPVERAPESDAAERLTEASQTLELHLRAGGELERQHGTRDRGRVGMRGPRVDEALQPSRIDDHVVVEVGQEGAGRLPHAAVASEVQAGDRLADVADARNPGHDLVRAAVGRRVVHHEDLEPRHAGGAALAQRDQRRQAPLQQVGTIVRADDGGDRRRRARLRRLREQLVPDALLEHRDALRRSEQSAPPHRDRARAPGGSARRTNATGRSCTRTVRPMPLSSASSAIAGSGRARSTVASR